MAIRSIWRGGDPADAISKLVLADVPVPIAGEGDILVEIKRASINPIDWKLFSAGYQGMFPSRISPTFLDLISVEQ